MTRSFSDLDLLQRLESGDAEAAALLFDRYARRLIGFARRRLDERVRSKVDAEDVVQSVFRNFCRRAPERPFNLDGPNSLWPMLVEMTLRRCGRWNRHFRTRKRDVQREQTPPLSDSDGANEPHDAAGPCPEDEAAMREMMERLLNSLDDKLAREVCQMRLQCYEIEEIARALQRSSATINRKIRYIKDRMKQLWPELPD